MNHITSYDSNDYLSNIFLAINHIFNIQLHVLLPIIFNNITRYQSHDNVSIILIANQQVMVKNIVFVTMPVAGRNT